MLKEDARDAHLGGCLIKQEKGSRVVFSLMNRILSAGLVGIPLGIEDELA